MTVKEKNDFIQSIADCVKEYAPKYGIMVHSPIIAQAILESNWGKSKLALYHNYFGLKCGSKWAGKSVNMKTMEEYTVGVKTRIRDNFRAYDSRKEGVKGYFEFINTKRYSNLKGITDPFKYLETIKKNGYATSSTYVQSLSRIIKDNNLTVYDSVGADIARKQAIEPTTHIEGNLRYSVGDTVYFAGSLHYTNSSAGAMGKGCKSGKATVTAVKAGAIHPYHLKAVTGQGSTVWGWVNEADIQDFVSQKSTYTVKAGDTLSSIAKAYGAMVDELARLNNIADVNKIFVGQVIRLK